MMTTLEPSNQQIPTTVVSSRSRKTTNQKSPPINARALPNKHKIIETKPVTLGQLRSDEDEFNAVMSSVEMTPAVHR